MTGMFSTDIGGVVSVIGVTNGITAKPESLIMIGVSKLAGMSIVLRSGETGCQSTEWMSETSVVGRVVSGPGRSKALTLTTGSLVESLSTAFTFDLLFLSTMHKANIGETAYHPVVIHGDGIEKWSITSKVRLGQSACEMTEWVSETTVKCHPAHSVLSSRLVAVTSGPGVGSVLAMVSMDVGVVSMSGTANLLLPGSQQVTFFGSGIACMGTRSLCAWVRLRPRQRVGYQRAA